jgi:CelD/BcsL family acetyltransferase involved in cellulose biosynthesis
MDGAAWAGLVQALAQTGGRVRLARAWTSGLWTVLPTEPDAARWRERIERERHRLRRSSGPERITALESVADVRMALHETDRLLRRSRGGDGLDVVPGGRHLVESLVRSSGPDAPVQPLALRLEAAGRAIGRAVALVRGERAVVLAVACDRSLPERRFAPGRLVFAGLIDALVERGVRAVDAGPGAAWFAERTDGGAVVPMRTCLLVPRDPRRVPFEAMTDFVGRLPSLGPFERFVARLRPWAEIDAED